MTADLFGFVPRARKDRYPNKPGHRGVATSMAAANAIEPAVGRLQQRIIDFLSEKHGGATYTEIMEGCDLAAPTVCGRMREMVLRTDGAGRAAPLVKKLDITRPTPSGRQAQIYVLTELGRQKATKRSA